MVNDSRRNRLTAMHIATLEMLEQASFTPAQAKAIAQVIEEVSATTISKEAFETHRQQLATREDLYRVKGELQSEIAQVKASQERIKGELLQWMIGLVMAQTGILVALLRLFPHG